MTDAFQSRLSNLIYYTIIYYHLLNIHIIKSIITEDRLQSLKQTTQLLDYDLSDKFGITNHILIMSPTCGNYVFVQSKFTSHPYEPYDFSGMSYT